MESAQQSSPTRKVVKIGPQPGPQTAFLASKATIVFYGGGAGSGKTAGLSLEGLRCHDVPKFGGIIFRRTSPQLEGPGSLWDLMCEWYALLGARLTQNPYKAVFPSGASLRLGHLQHEKDKYDHQGKGYGFIGFDELPHFTESQVWYLISRNRSTSGALPYVRATMNADSASWVKNWILWYLDDNGEYARPERSGVLRYFYRSDDDTLDWDTDPVALRARHPEQEYEPISFTYISAKLEDNPILTTINPAYRAMLMLLPKVEREQLLGSNWKIKPAAGLYFRRDFFRIVDRPPPDIDLIVRAWDKAATQVTTETPDPDWTSGVRMGITRDGVLVVMHLKTLRGSPKQVLDAMRGMAVGDGVTTTVCVWQDPGAAGVTDRDLTIGHLAGFNVETTVAAENKVTYAGPFSTQAEARNVLIVRGEWNERYLSQLEDFPDGSHDDMVDASSLACLQLYNNPGLAYQRGWAKLGEESPD